MKKEYPYTLIAHIYTIYILLPNGILWLLVVTVNPEMLLSVKKVPEKLVTIVLEFSQMYDWLCVWSMDYLFMYCLFPTKQRYLPFFC